MFAFLQTDLGYSKISISRKLKFYFLTFHKTKLINILKW